MTRQTASRPGRWTEREHRLGYNLEVKRIELRCSRKMLRFLREGSTCRAGGSLNPEWRQGLQKEEEAARKLFISTG